MNLYTIIFEFMGGTYYRRKKAILNVIKNNIENKELIDFKEDLLDEFNFWIEEIGISPLDKLRNVWYFSFSYEDESYHCHIIKTINL